MKKIVPSLFIGAALLAASCTKPVDMPQVDQKSKTIESTEHQGIAIGEPNPSAPDGNTGAAATPPVLIEDTVPGGAYKDYSADALATAQREHRKVVLFFHANWCPECRAADKVFREQPTAIPDGVTLFKVDYDTATALKTKYGVTHQHTFVQIDGDGAMLSKWVSGETELLSQNIK